MGDVERTCSPMKVNNTKPLLKYARQIRANYAPRKYKLCEEDGVPGDSCACSNANSSVTLQNASGKSKKSQRDHEVKPSQPERKMLKNKSTSNRKEVCASIHINVEPLARLSPLRNVRKSTSDDKNSPKVSPNKRKAIQFSTNNANSLTSEDMESDNLIKTLKSQSSAPLSGRPKKRIKLTLSQGKDVVQTINDQGTSSNTTTNERNPGNHVNMIHQCNICNKNLPTKGSLENHIHWHVEKKMFKCMVCQRTFKSFNQFVRHQQLHSKTKVEKSTVKSPESKDNSKNVSKTKAKKTHKCKICFQTFWRPGKLKVHMLTHTSTKKYRCYVCYKEFMNFGWIKYHAQKIHGLTQLSKRDVKIPQRKLKSSNSKQQSSTLPGPQVQKEGENNIVKKSRAPKPVLVRHSGKRGTKSCHETGQNRKTRAPKPICVRFSSKQDTKSNRETGQNQKTQAPKPIRLHLSDKQVTDSNRETGQNEKIPTPKPIQVCLSDKDTESNCKRKEHRCGVCHNVYSSNFYLGEHLRLHTGEKAFECHICNEYFMWPHQLKTHCRSAHKAKPKFKCNECGVLFRSVKLLRRHQQATHEDKAKASNPESDQDNIHKCNKCGQAFKSLHGLRRHFTVHKEDLPPPPQTPPCRYSSRLRVSTSSKPQKPSPTSQDHSPTSRDSSLALQGASTTRLKSSKNTSSHSQSSRVESEQDVRYETELGNEEQSSSKTEGEKWQWIRLSRENGQLDYRCGLCTDNRRFYQVSSVRKHLGMVHRDYTEDLVEPPGLYDDLPEETSEQSGNIPGASSTGNSPTSQTPSVEKDCACVDNGRDVTSHSPNECPVQNKESSEPKNVPNGTPVLKCKHCDEEFDSLEREKFQEHELSHELEAAEPMGMTYACFECEVEFATANQLMEHYEKEH